MTNKVSSKESIMIEGFEVGEENQNSTQKPSWNHLEDAPTVAKDTKAAREPYWDTPFVVGASRHLSSEEFSPRDEKQPRRPGFWRRRWRHFRRYWILYAIGAFILLAVGLPVL